MEQAPPPVSEKGRPEVHRHTTSAARVITGLSRCKKRRLLLVGGVLLCVLVTILYLVLSGRTPGLRPQPEPRSARTTEGTQPTSSLTKSLGMQFALIPAGEFQMGSTSGADDERPVRPVRIGKSFYLGIHEVTQGQWEAAMGNNPSQFKGDANRPVETISWEEVPKFIDKLNTREGGMQYSLSTETEWEQATRRFLQCPAVNALTSRASTLGSGGWRTAKTR
jgi:formylglycine-generating enzyme required for sulfatase activity